jgi:hypothetical protein
MGGVLTPAAEPAYFARVISNKTLADRLSASGVLACGAGRVHALVGFFNLLRFGMSQTVVGRGNVVSPAFSLPDGLMSVVIAFALVNLLVLLEVADRLSLKNDLEIAREIQKSMLPPGRLRAPGAGGAGFTRPANTVGGDFTRSCAWTAAS